MLLSSCSIPAWFLLTSKQILCCLRLFRLLSLCFLVSFVVPRFRSSPAPWPPSRSLPPTSLRLSSCQSHRFSYNEPMLVESCTQSLCDLALRFGEGEEDSMVRE